MRPKATFLVTVLILVSAVLGSVFAEGPAVRSFATPTQAVATCGIYCGTERWSVKTLSDADRDKVQLAPKEVTVEWLISQKPQARLPTDRRVIPIETQTYKIRAFLVAYKLEADQDFHVVIADVEDPSKTMIAEVPSPECAGACASGHAEEFRSARAVIAGLPEPVPPVIVVVTGVGFFDFLHGQTGAAPNGIELHPVLKIELESGSAPPSSSPSQASAEGENSEVKVGSIQGVAFTIAPEAAGTATQSRANSWGNARLRRRVTDLPMTARAHQVASSKKEADNCEQGQPRKKWRALGDDL